MGQSSEPIASSRYMRMLSRPAVTSDRNEPGRGAGGVLGHTEPFIESVGGAEGSHGDSIRVDC